MITHFILILQPNRLSMFEQTSNDKFQLFKYKGEDFYDFALTDNNYQEISAIIVGYIKDELNEDNLSDANFTFINDNSNLNLILHLLSNIVPCNKITVLDFESILPELLLKKEEIKPQETRFVRFEERCYKVNIDKDGFATVLKTKDCGKKFYNLKISEIPQILISNYNFIFDKKKINILENDLLIEKDKNIKLNMKFEVLSNTSNLLKDEVSKKNEFIKRQNEKALVAILKIGELDQFLNSQIQEDFNRLNKSNAEKTKDKIDQFFRKYENFEKHKTKKYFEILKEKRDFLVIKKLIEKNPNYRYNHTNYPDITSYIEKFKELYPKSKYLKELKEVKELSPSSVFKLFLNGIG